MEAKITKKDEYSLEMELEDEDYALMDIVRHELLEDEMVEYAGVAVPHPLLRRINLKLRAKGDPEEALRRGIERAREKASKLLDALTELS